MYYLTRIHLNIMFLVIAPTNIKPCLTFRQRDNEYTKTNNIYFLSDTYTLHVHTLKINWFSHPRMYHYNITYLSHAHIFKISHAH